MPPHCDCGQEITGDTEFCPACNANLRAERAEERARMLADACNGWRTRCAELEEKLKRADR
jgi:hypothetical protein